MKWILICLNMKNNTFVALGLPRSGTTLCKQIFSRIFTNVTMSHEFDESFKLDLIILRDIRDCIVSLKQAKKDFDFNNLKTSDDINSLLNENYVLSSAMNIFTNKTDVPILKYEMFHVDRSCIYNLIRNEFNIKVNKETEEKINQETSISANIEIQNKFHSFNEWDKESGIHGNHLNGGEIGKWQYLIPINLHTYFKKRIREIIGDEAYIFFT